MPKSSNRRKDGSVHSGRKATVVGTDRATATFGLQGDRACRMEGRRHSN